MEIEEIIEMEVDVQETGLQGLSAYEVYIQNGGNLSETEWLESLRGQDGIDGKNGKSAYQVWLELGNVGTEQDFINSLKGQDGVDGSDYVLTTEDKQEIVNTILAEFPNAEEVSY